jgi:tRNA A-37 threonylcarbamoyl transferase component Bud32
VKLSKKNLIKIEEDVIIKKFTHSIDFYTEYFYYKEFHLLSVIPQLIDKKQNTLILKRIVGKNLYQLLNDNLSFSIMKKSLQSLAKSLSIFHLSSYCLYNNSCIIHKDTNLKNYIFINNLVYLIDFSDIEIGNPLSDIYSLFLFLCESFSIDDFKIIVKIFFDTYLKNLSIQTDNQQKILAVEIARFDNRRKLFRKSLCTNKLAIVDKNREYLKNITI